MAIAANALILNAACHLSLHALVNLPTGHGASTARKWHREKCNMLAIWIVARRIGMTENRLLEIIDGREIDKHAASL